VPPVMSMCVLTSISVPAPKICNGLVAMGVSIVTDTVLGVPPVPAVPVPEPVGGGGGWNGFWFVGAQQPSASASAPSAAERTPRLTA